MRLKGHSSVSTFVCAIHAICGSINAFPSSHIRFPRHRFMSERGPCLKHTQVCTPRSFTPPHLQLTFSVIFGNIYKRDTELEIYSRAAFSLRKSVPVTGCDQSPSLPLFFILSFFYRSIKFSTIWVGCVGPGEEGTDEGCGVARAHRKEKSLVRAL